MKFALPFALCLAFAASACDTIENRRSFYAKKKADGPYTRSLRDDTWEQTKTVDVEYEEAKKMRAQQRVMKAPVEGAPDDGL